MIKFFRRFLRWLKVFPEVIVPGYGVRKYLAGVRTAMKKHDMATAPSEDYFRDRYMCIMDSVVASQDKRYEGLRILDAGCGQGRLTEEFLRRGSRVDALDALPEVIEKAKLHCSRSGFKPESVRWITGEMPKALSSLPLGGYDMVVCTEVLYMLPDFQEAIQKMISLLSPGGILVVSLRTRLYYLLYSLISHDPAGFRAAFAESNYHALGNPLSWIDPEIFERSLENLSMRGIRRWGIGILTGLEGDPSAKFCVPGELKADEQILMGTVEDTIGPLYSDAGRYIVFSGVKKK
jgi:SAM-dependent methyltransferase